LDVSGTLNALAQGAALYLIAAFFEKLLMRGYPFQALLRDYPTWVAVLVMSAIFAAFPQRKSSFSWLAFLNTFIAGIWLSIAYLKTRFVVAWRQGFHTGWNFAMGVLFKFSVSGTPRSTDALCGRHCPRKSLADRRRLRTGRGVVATLVIILCAIWLWRTKWFAPSEKMTRL